ncbi:MAG TPA: PD-(D/E)XK nuclease family protein [Candidatus Paceibacterota bacterium]|nr:PD-(D/E)XK nuclease family protein [Candidatus Paceibacterota bacterium]
MANRRKPKLPIAYWSHSSLVAFLRNPLTWYKRYVRKIYDIPATPSSVIGRAAHLALQHFYSGTEKEVAIALGLEGLRNVPDFEIEFGKAKSRAAKKKRRLQMEREYLQAIGLYLERPPKHKVLAVEVAGIAEVQGLALPVKAISDLVVESRVEKGAVDIVDHKFVNAFSASGAAKPLFMLQAMFNYYTVRELFGRPVRRFIVYECKRTKNRDGRAQMRRYIFDFKGAEADFELFHRLVNDATEQLLHMKAFLPNPSDMFEGEHSFEVYRLRLLEEEN